MEKIMIMNESQSLYIGQVLCLAMFVRAFLFVGVFMFHDVSTVVGLESANTLSDTVLVDQIIGHASHLYQYIVLWHYLHNQSLCIA